MTEAADDKPAAVDSERLRTSPAAVDEALKQLSPKSMAIKSDSEGANIQDTLDTNTNAESKPLTTAKSNHTPEEVANNEGSGITEVVGGQEEDSFVKQIKSRTPGKRHSRIEDSVEALDALEEEIEKFGGLIPEPTDLKSPAKTKKQTKGPINITNTKPNGSSKIKKSTTLAAKADSRSPVKSARPSVSKPVTQSPMIRKTGPSLGDDPSLEHEAKTQKAEPTPRVDPSTSQAALKKRVSSVHKAPFQPAKSTKPPTRAAFELPGDAISRKLKEQREERLKREEEEKSKQRMFKARPIRRSEAPEVKLTAAAKARLSMARGEPVNPNAAKNEVLNPSLSACRGSLAAAGKNKRLSSLSVAKRSADPPSANSSAHATRVPSLNASTINRKLSGPSAPRPAPTADNLAHQKVRGKEVFGRAKVEIQERENAKKEKEEAAKKARAEAAERGRIASRAWAEQQKLKKLEADKSKNKPRVAVT